MKIEEGNELIIPIPLNPSDESYWFARWLNWYFIPWNPDDGTWIDMENHAFTTQDLLKEFRDANSSTVQS